MTTTTTEADEFAHLFDMKAGQRDVLFTKKNARLGAKLMHADPGRFEKLIDALGANGMKRLREWERLCRQELRKAQKRSAGAAPKTDKPVIDYSTPLDTARLFAETSCPNLLQHLGDWLDYNGSAYEALEDRTVRQRLQRFLETAVAIGFAPDGTVRYEPVKITPSLIGSVMEVMASDVHVARDVHRPPCWLDPQMDDPTPREIMSCANGLLHLPSGRLLDASPRFFTHSALPFAYEPDAPEPKRWLECLEQWWPDSPESRECLQEIFGYLLTPDTSMQKIILLIGRSRGGKGTIIRVLVYLLGSANHGSPTLDQLAQPFGMQSLIGKQLAVMTDLYVHKARGASLAVENLLRVSGEDDVTVQRKHKTDWIGRLPARFLLAGTVAPILPDMSGSLANRYVPLLMKQTFVDREDTNLFDGKLVPEMPGILNWAIEGWRRLKKRGHFVLTKEGADLVRELRARANPVEAFLRECCTIEKGARIKKDMLYEEFENWSMTLDGLSYHHMEQQEFTRRLVVASGYRIDETRPRTGEGGQQERHYVNVKLREDSMPEEE